MNLEKFRKTYYNGTPLISDGHYDALVDMYGEDSGLGDSGTIPHLYKMYSQQKVYDSEPTPSACNGEELIESPKLDGSAISLLYVAGFLVQGLTRGDGSLGKDISDKVLLMDSIPKQLNNSDKVQITGEVMFSGGSENDRNMSAGSLGLKDLVEFKEREKELTFIAYSIFNIGLDTYKQDMDYLKKQGFNTVLSIKFDDYITDGKVFRINNNNKYHNLGYTAKHPKGSYALKKRSDEACAISVISDVKWQTGASGKVTPVCIFNEIDLDGAKTTKATLNNAGYVEKLKIDISDEILVCRAGHVIPKIIANLTKDIYL